ncbi:hypothetical protein R6Q57_004354 [Mikania cordata]
MYNTTSFFITKDTQDVHMTLVTSLVNKRPVVIFSKSSCCMCHTIKTLISNFGANPTVYELDEHPDGKQSTREGTKRTRVQAKCASCVHRRGPDWWC